jgi:predicted ATP-dependent serine protease
MEDNLEKALADATLRRNKVIKNFTSTGVRELDEMLGGGFMPGSCSFSTDLGSGGELILR